MKNNISGVAAFLASLALLGGCASMPEPIAKAGEDIKDLFGRMRDGIKGIGVSSQSDVQGSPRAEAAKRYSYDARKGPLLEIEELSLTPDSVPPGGSLEASVRFTGLAPDSAQQVRITETRTILVDGDPIQLGQPRQREFPQGTHTSIFKLTMPQSIPKGRYTLVTSISDGKNTKTHRNTFTVLADAGGTTATPPVKTAASRTQAESNPNAQPNIPSKSAVAPGKPIVRRSDVRQLPSPPNQLTQIDPCVLYKCGDGDKVKVMANEPVFDGPSATAQRVGSLAKGTVVMATDAAFLTVKPGIVRVRERSQSAENPQYYFEPGDIVHRYTNWGEGCETIWTRGYLYGYFDPGKRPGGMQQVRKDLISCVTPPEGEQLQQGEFETWIKFKSARGASGWLRLREGKYEFGG